jgi:acid phosphatase type 7
MRWSFGCLVLLTLCFAGCPPVVGHEGHGSEPLGRWLFWPDYRLPQRAANYPGPRPDYPLTEFAPVDAETHPLVFFGEKPTERVARLLPSDALPTRAFSIELWLVDHVNQPVGALVTVKGRTIADAPAWVLGYHDRKVLFSLRTAAQPDGVTLRAESARGWKRYWRHVVATYDGFTARLYLNGELVGADESGGGQVQLPTGADLEATAYLAREPGMDLGNLLREVRLWPHALSVEEVVHRFTNLQYRVEEGILFEDQFHFTAGPYLNYATPDGIRFIWETDRPSTAELHYGRQLPFDQVKRIETAGRIHALELEGLAPEANYFYEIIARDEAGAEIRSGELTFKTAVREGSPYSFAVIGDTESRPHINDIIAKAVWSERPNFVMNVGDLTDGGQQHHKFEWNLEYFLGMNQLISRVPMFPVPGNGESDLHWYNRYHSLPLPRNYYSFRFGNAEFFMLDSNRPMGPGSEQYAWLDEQLGRSTARWKFAAHHHPTYTSDEDDYGDTWKGGSAQGDLKVRSVVPLYEKHHVDIVFFGHLHTYERSWPVAEGRVNLQQGVRYVQTGGAGGNLEDFAPTRNWHSTKLYRGHHYCIVNIFEGRLRFQMFDSEGRLRDMFELEKP